MSFEQFVEVVKNQVKEIAGPEYTVSVVGVLKVNREFQSILVRHIHRKAAPSIYLEDYFTEYQKGKGVHQIAKEIIEMSKERKLEIEEFTENIQSYEWVKSRLRVKLINLDRNRKFLQAIPYEKILDLAIVPYVLLSSGEQSMTMTVNYPILDKWQVDKEELLEVAKENTLKMQPLIMEALSEYMIRILQEGNNTESGYVQDEIKSILDIKASRNEMYILTNKENQYGAFGALQIEGLHDLANKLGVDKLYLLPSSVHEILALPEGIMGVEQLREMVYCVNSTEVKEEEFLSDMVYEYSIIENKVSVA